MLNHRVISAIDADSFEISIYQKLPEYKHTVGFPCVVSTGLDSERIVSVSQEANLRGISRSMTVSKAKDKVSDLIVIPKTSLFNKPESKLLRTASYTLRNAILEFFSYHSPEICILKEEESISNIHLEINGNDEFYVDLSRPVKIMIDKGIEPHLDTRRKLIFECKSDQYYGTNMNLIRPFHNVSHRELEEEIKSLAFGAQIMQQLCEFVKEKTGYVCSAGVGVNKVVAKIACKLHKPAGVTVLTTEGIPRVSEDFHYKEIPGLGGTLGDRMSGMFGNDMTMSELHFIWRSYSLSGFTMVKKHFTTEEIEKVMELSRGICNINVEHRIMNKWVTSGKNNLNSLNCNDLNTKLRNVMMDLAKDIADRIEEESVWNIREAEKMKLELKYNLEHHSVKEEHFLLSGFQFGLSPLDIFNEAWNAAFHHSNSIPPHIRSVKCIKFVVTKFKSVGNVIRMVKEKIQLERTSRWFMEDSKEAYNPSTWNVEGNRLKCMVRKLNNFRFK